MPSSHTAAAAGGFTGTFDAEFVIIAIAFTGLGLARVDGAVAHEPFKRGQGAIDASSGTSGTGLGADARADGEGRAASALGCRGVDVSQARRLGFGHCRGRAARRYGNYPAVGGVGFFPWARHPGEVCW